MERNKNLNNFRNKSSINLVISQKKSIIFAVGKIISKNIKNKTT